MGEAYLRRKNLYVRSEISQLAKVEDTLDVTIPPIVVQAFEYTFINESFTEDINVQDTITIDAFEYLFINESFTEDINVIDTISINAFEYTFADQSFTEDINVIDTIEQEAILYQLESDSVSDSFIVDAAVEAESVFPDVESPTLSNAFSVGQETANIDVINVNDFGVRVYFSLTNANGQPNTTNDFIELPAENQPGYAETVQIHNYFTLEGNESYTFYARAYDLALNNSSLLSTRNFTTLKYNFDFAPAWVSQDLVVNETNIIFAYQNNNDVSATLRVEVRDSGGNQAMNTISTNINAGQTLIFDSNDYNDSFTDGSTYTFDANFEKLDYNDSSTTTNSVTTESSAVFYTVTFKDWDGTTLKTQSVEQGNDASAPADPSRTGYVFDGWDTTFTNVQSNLTVTAEYLKLYTVTFKDWDGTTLKTQSVAEGSDASAPSDPSRTGYAFTGWDTTFTNVQSNLTVTAEYLIKTLTPTTSVSGQADTSEVSFSIENTDSVGGTAQWQIRKNSATGSLEASESSVSIGPSSNASTRVISASATGLDDGTKYVLTNVFVTATDKAKSDEGTEREATTTEITEKPSITNLTFDQSSVSFKLTNNDDATADVYYELDDTTPDEYDVSIGAGLSENKTITGLTANQEYTLYATAEASDKARSGNVSETFTTDPTPQTDKPTISFVSKTDTSITYDIKNEDDSQATIIHEVGDSTPDANSIIVAGGSSTGDITKTGLNASTSYTVYATAQAANEDKSDVASLEITTNDPTYTLRARSNGVSAVDVTIGGTSYSLTTSYQNTATTTSNTTVSLSAPASVTVGGNTYNFAEWYDVSAGSSISTNTSATLTWGKASDPLNDKDIEARYIPGGFG